MGKQSKSAESSLRSNLPWLDITHTSQISLHQTPGQDQVTFYLWGSWKLEMIRYHNPESTEA
jgi:hypothetical protein